MIHNQALKESHRSFKWRPWVFNFNSHQLCSSTWTLTLFLGTVIPPTRRSRKCEVSPIRQESENKWDTRCFWMWQYLLISTTISFWLHQLICTQVGIFACYQFVSREGRDGWLVMTDGMCWLGAVLNYSRTFVHSSRVKDPDWIKILWAWVIIKALNNVDLNVRSHQWSVMVCNQGSISLCSATGSDKIKEWLNQKELTNYSCVLVSFNQERVII